jgi:hypothetical protein
VRLACAAPVGRRSKTNREGVRGMGSSPDFAVFCLIFQQLVFSRWLEAGGASNQSRNASAPQAVADSGAGQRAADRPGSGWQSLPHSAGAARNG